MAQKRWVVSLQDTDVSSFALASPSGNDVATNCVHRLARVTAAPVLVLSSQVHGSDFSFFSPREYLLYQRYSVIPGGSVLVSDDCHMTKPPEHFEGIFGFKI